MTIHNRMDSENKHKGDKERNVNNGRCYMNRSRSRALFRVTRYEGPQSISCDSKSFCLGAKVALCPLIISITMIYQSNV